MSLLLGKTITKHIAIPSLGRGFLSHRSGHQCPAQAPTRVMILPCSPTLSLLPPFRILLSPDFSLPFTLFLPPFAHFKCMRSSREPMGYSSPTGSSQAETETPQKPGPAASPSADAQQSPRRTRPNEVAGSHPLPASWWLLHWTPLSMAWVPLDWTDRQMERQKQTDEIALSCQTPISCRVTKLSLHGGEHWTGSREVHYFWNTGSIGHSTKGSC